MSNDLFGFDEALRIIKRGGKVTRKKWNNDEHKVCVFKCPIKMFSGNCETTVKHSVKTINNNAVVNMPYIIKTQGVEIFTADWSPDQDDLFADDWEEVYPNIFIDTNQYFETINTRAGLRDAKEKVGNAYKEYAGDSFYNLLCSNNTLEEVFSLKNCSPSFGLRIEHRGQLTLGEYLDSIGATRV